MTDTRARVEGVIATADIPTFVAALMDTYARNVNGGADFLEVRMYVDEALAVDGHATECGWLAIDNGYPSLTIKADARVRLADALDDEDRRADDAAAARVESSYLNGR